MGTPKPAAYILQKLLDAKFNIVAVVTQPDKPKGRGLKLQECETAAAASAAGLEVIKPESARDPGFIGKIAGIKPDLVVIVAYGKILPGEFLSVPRFGCINVHASLLPKYRGASPIQTALLDGEKETGVTIFGLNEKMDEGGIISSKAVGIDDADDSESLSTKLFRAGADILINVIADIGISGVKPHVIPQDHSKATYCRLIRKEDSKIDFTLSAQDIHNKIRAFTQWPGAAADFKGKKIKFLRAKPVPDLSSGRQPGEVVGIVKNEGFIVSAGNGALLVTRVQPESSRPMDATAFIQGYRVEEGDMFNY